MATMTTETMTTETRTTVPAGRRGEVDARLRELAAKCAKKGIGVPSWSFGAPFLTRDEGMRVEIVLEHAQPCFAGWGFVAALTHIEGETIVRARIGVECPTEYRARGPVCDHCGHTRRRSETYVIRHEDGRTRQVGSTCLVDFTGHDEAHKIVDAANIEREVRDLVESYGCKVAHDNLLAYLGFVCAEIRTGGWVSAGKAQEQGGACTADIAFSVYSGAKPGERPTAEDAAEAQAALDWAAALNGDNDYQHNIAALARALTFTSRTMRIAASIPAARSGATARAREQANRLVSEHTGTVGVRETWEVVLTYVTGYATDYGWTTVCGFVTDAGAVLLWRASGAAPDKQDVGTRYKVTARVKAHTVYKGTKQTDITRAKLVAVVALAA
jgi:hypothetical protein